jgi:homocitrate synthase NifV
MAIYFDKDSKVSIIDRTIIELLQLMPDLKKLGFLYLCWLLNGYGVDLFEINRRVLAKLNKIPSGLDFILRIESEKDIELLETYHLKKCIINGKYAAEDLMKQIEGKGISILLEIPVITDEDITTAIFNVNGLLKYADMIRIVGIERVESFSWMSKIKSILQGTNIKIDICPSNRLSMATSIALEAVLENTDSLSLSFTGIGGIDGFAALEEVLLAIAVLKGMKNDITLKTLPDTVSYFKKITGINISPIKPVIGKNIFMYESGLHADGIAKNPVTYELFEPELVGQKRSLMIGKHSGRASIVFKLKEMGIECKMDEAEEFLKVVRDISIHMGRYLNEDETAHLYTIHRSKEKIEELVK